MSGGIVSIVIHELPINTGLLSWQNKKNITGFWTAKKREEKMNNLNERQKIANKKIEVYDSEQHAIAKELVYQQDNNIRENFNAKILAKPSTPSHKRKSKNFEHDKPNKPNKVYHYLGGSKVE